MVSRFAGWLLLVLLAGPVSAAEVAGVKIADAERVGNADLVLNGAGLRKRAFFQVYAIGLYLPQKMPTATDAIGAAGPKRVSIHMLRDVGAEQFGEALMEGMRDNHSEGEMKALEPRIRQLTAIMAGMKEAKEGMRITLDLVPGAGTQVTVQGKPSGAPIPGEDFYRALLRVWLGDNPVQGDLKKALLGEKR